MMCTADPYCHIALTKYIYANKRVEPFAYMRIKVAQLDLFGSRILALLMMLTPQFLSVVMYGVWIDRVVRCRVVVCLMLFHSGKWIVINHPPPPPHPSPGSPTHRHCPCTYTSISI